MSSGQWETVSKRKDKGTQKSVCQTIKKKTENYGSVKVEDVLAKSQVKNIFSNGKNKENKPVENKKVPELGSKKTTKKQEKLVEISKPKPPKSIESALKLIDANEFKSHLENSKSRFPEAPIVWLKDLTHFLNQRICLEVPDPVFSTKVKNFPLLALPSETQSVIETAIQDANESNVQLFFDILLTSMATDMSKNLPVLGHKIFLQYIALNEPRLVIVNLPKHCVLRTSYQNRPNIGLSILWAVGQAGVSNFEAGLTIFQELMLPLIELKNYARFIVKYLLDLTSSHKQASLTSDQFLCLLELIFSNKKNFPNDLKKDLIAVIPNLKSYLFSNNKKENYVEAYLKKMASCGSGAYQECLCEVIIEDFKRDTINLEHLCKTFTNNSTASATLLHYIDDNWKKVLKVLNKKVFTEWLKRMVVASNELLLKKKKDEGLRETAHIAEKLLAKMTGTKKSRSTFKLLFFITCLITSSFIYYDIKQEGSWQKSNTNRILKQSGVCHYSHLVLNKTQEGLLFIDHQIEGNFPNYHKTVIEFSTPYIELGQKLGKVFGNIFTNMKEAAQEKYPIIIQSIESYAPGLVQQSQNVVCTAWSSSTSYFNRSVDYLKNDVFVGQLSPENMQKIMLEAFNITQHKATECYHWLYEKVQSVIK